MLSVLEWESLMSLVVLNSELKFRSEGICGFKEVWICVRETYIENGERVVDVFACFNRRCREKRADAEQLMHISTEQIITS